MGDTFHAHPLTIVTNLGRVLYLIIIPVLRGVWGVLRGDYTTWAGGAWIDLTILAVMLFAAVLRWYVLTYRYSAAGLYVTKGLFQRRKTCIPWERVTTVSVVLPFFLRPLRAARLHADTLGGGWRGADFTVLLRPRVARQILRQVNDAPDAGGFNYTPGTRSILALSLLTSNSFVGIVFIATFISQSGKLLGNRFSIMLLGTVEELIRALAFGIPPAAAMLAYLLLAGWLVAFWMTFVRYKNMFISRKEGQLSIRGGLFTHREYAIHTGGINFIDVRQTVLTKALRLKSLYISAVGYGKQRDDISCIVPTETHPVFSSCCEHLFPAFKTRANDLAPPRRGVLRFIASPLTLCLLIPAVMFVFLYLFPAWTTFTLFVGLMLMVPCLFFLAVRVMDFATSGFSAADGQMTMRYSKGFYLHTVTIPCHKVALYELRQSPIQRISGSCDLFVRTYAESRYVHRCRNLNRQRLEKLLEAL